MNRVWSRTAFRMVVAAVAGMAVLAGVVIASAPFEKRVTYPFNRGNSLGVVDAISECGAPVANVLRDDPRPDEVVELPGAPFTRIHVDGFACLAPSRRRAAGGLLLMIAGAVSLTVLLLGRRGRQREITKAVAPATS